MPKLTNCSIAIKLLTQSIYISSHILLVRNKKCVLAVLYFANLTSIFFVLVAMDLAMECLQRHDKINLKIHFESAIPSYSTRNSLSHYACGIYPTRNAILLYKLN
jgi:hypothetical protein